MFSFKYCLGYPIKITQKKDNEPVNLDLSSSAWYSVGNDKTETATGGGM